MEDQGEKKEGQMNGRIERKKSEELSSSPGRKASRLRKTFQG